MTTSFKRVNSKSLEYEKLRQRGNYYFCPVNYKGAPLVIETPALITPTGINVDETRYWMDVELDVVKNVDHQLLYDMFKMVDDRCIDECIDNMERWFKNPNVDQTFIEEHFKSPLTPGWANEPALLRVEIVSERPEDLIDIDGNVISPDDITALSTVVIKMQLLGMWASEKFLGCHWRALSVKANLDHELSGVRRSSSPRHISPPPNVSRRSRTSAVEKSSKKEEPAPLKKEAAPLKKEAAPQKKEAAPSQTRRAQPREAQEEEHDDTLELEAARKARVQDMLKRFQATKEQQVDEEYSDYTDDIETPRRRRSSDIETPRRRRSSEDHRRPSDDRRRRSSLNDVRRDSRQDSSDRSYTDDYSDDRRRSSEYERERPSRYSEDDRSRSRHYHSSRRSE